MPEIVLHITLTILFIFTNHWFLFIFNVPLDLWFAYKFVFALWFHIHLYFILFSRYFKRQPGQLGIYDPLEINNRRNIKTNMRVRIQLIEY